MYFDSKDSLILLKSPNHPPDRSMSIDQIHTKQGKIWAIPILQKVSWSKVILTIGQIPQDSFEQLFNSTNKYYLTNGQLNKSQLKYFLIKQYAFCTYLNSPNSSLNTE